MDAIGSAHALLAKHAPGFCLGVLAGSDVQARIRAALKVRPARQRERSSPLDPVLVFWLVLAMGLFRSLSIPNVFAHLMDAWRRQLRGLPLRPVTDGALAHARERLGVAPVPVSVRVANARSVLLALEQIGQQHPDGDRGGADRHDLDERALFQAATV